MKNSAESITWRDLRSEQKIKFVHLLPDDKALGRSVIFSSFNFNSPIKESSICKHNELNRNTRKKTINIMTKTIKH